MDKERSAVNDSESLTEQEIGPLMLKMRKWKPPHENYGYLYPPTIVGNIGYSGCIAIVSATSPENFGIEIRTRRGNKINEFKITSTHPAFETVRTVFLEHKSKFPAPEPVVVNKSVYLARIREVLRR